MCFFDVRTKLVFVLLFTILVFIVDKLPVAVFLLLLSAVIRIISKALSGINKTAENHAGSSRNFPLVKNLTLLAAFIILIQMIFGPGSSYIVKPLFPSSLPALGGLGSLKWEGLLLGVIIVCRLFALVIILPVFTETSSPYQIAAGLCAAGLNYRTAFIITMSFNLVYLFRDEALVIMDAQRLRCQRSFERRNSGSILSRVRAYSGLLLPLMLGAMRKAQRSSDAMDSRAFGIYKKRTWIDKPVMKIRDFICITGCVIFFTGVLFVNFSLIA
ncbi:MAG: energy-coupling factor transporter transmembrane protein EcfT [Treponema sp.]|nr:energy-coupling factor transporter transmembrane protein EcfT [Treponema sp.]